jgi:coenzyme F420 hydrogenase subunit beta
VPAETDSRSLARVFKADTCAGCGACASLAPEAISMKLNAAGYLRPSQTSTVSEDIDNRIADVCPGITLQQPQTGGADHVLWGPIIASRAGHSTDPDLRHHASSGGGLSALVIHLLETKQVDHVIHVAADAKSPLDNITTVSSTREGVFGGAGSRYAPSAPLANLHSYLDQPGRFALIGKPCDISAARAMAKADARIDAKIPFMLSFFCAGVPSRKGTQQIMEKLGVKEQDVASFRYRGDGWPGYATAVTRNGESKRMSYADSWGNILSKHVQARCKICPDGTGGAADVVCADAWESDENGYPRFAELEGQSLILSRTAKGESLVQESMAAGSIIAEGFDVTKIAPMQPGQFRRKRVLFSRLLAMRVMMMDVPRYHGYHLIRAARFAGLADNARNFLGMFKRLMRPR